MTGILALNSAIAAAAAVLALVVALAVAVMTDVECCQRYYRYMV